LNLWVVIDGGRFNPLDKFYIVPAGFVVAVTTRLLFMGLIKTLELLNPNNDKLDIVKIPTDSIDDKHEKDNKQAVDELLRVLKEEFNMQKTDDKFLKEV